ncbi:MAG TPA: universal stress protein, partial [Ktedonobacteraceae bacterium]|nr:universal stress protein [Ktedonobacteraceae bacterium]
MTATLLEDAETTGCTDDEELSGSYDFLAMTTHGWEGVQHRMMGSIAERVLRTTTLPLLLIPSREPS